MNKWVAAPFLAKIEKITALGSTFSPKIDFLVDSGVPWGTQKSLPREAKEWPTLAMDPPGTNLGSFWAPDRFFLDFSTPFGCLWTPFGVPQGFILRKTVMNFQSFSWFRLVGRMSLLVVVLGCLARLVGLVGWFDCADWLVDGAFVKLSRRNAWKHRAFHFHQYP